MKKSQENLVNVHPTVKRFLALILKIPGDKIVTLAMQSSSVFKIDIKNEKIGYEPDHELLFQLKLARAFVEGGGITIREFLPLKIRHKTPDGKELWIPQKNLYGATLGENRWEGLDAETLRQCYATDHRTGMPMPSEEGVFYKNFPNA